MSGSPTSPRVESATGVKDGRDQGVGGSDAAAILGVSPWRDRLDVWQEKTHHPGWAPRAQTAAMRWGILLEPLVAMEYERTARVKVEQSPGRLWHENGIQFGTPDRFVFTPVGIAGLWEGKTAQDPAVWEAGVPEHYIPQVQQYLAITGLPWCDVSVLLPGGDFRTYRMESDLGYQIDLEERVVDFWQRYVLTGQVPPEGRDRPDLVFPRQHEPESRLVVAPDTALDRIVHEILGTKETLAELEGELGVSINQAKMVIGEHAGADAPDWTVHWRLSKAPEKVGWEAVATTLWNTLAVVRRLYPDWRDGPAAAHLDPGLFDTVVSLYTMQGAAARPFLVKRKETK